jgi:hypothetical protein
MNLERRARRPVRRVGRMSNLISKPRLIFLIVLLLLLTSAGQTQAAGPDELQWAKKAGGTGFDGGSGIATDRYGNSLVTGWFRETATFGAGEADETSLTSAGDSDIFVTKYDRNGALLWAKKAGGTAFDAGYNIAIDGDGNSLVTGCFEGTATFGAGEANETSLTSAGDSDIFVAKYDRNGALLWAKKAGGTGFDAGNGIAIDGDGNSLVTGLFQGTATFGDSEAGETSLTSAGDADVFVAKYDRNGALLWAKKAGGTDPDEGRDIATDGDGNSLVTGYFSETATFGAGEADETSLTSAGNWEIFVAKFDRNGALLWAKKAGGTDPDWGSAITTDGYGNSLVTGWFRETATFGAGEANETSLTSAGDRDIFVAKYDRNGALLWAKKAGGTASDAGSDIAIDGDGNSLVTGLFQGTATFGAGEANETSLTSAGDGDIFVAKYDPNGALLWAKKAGGTGLDAGHDIAIDGDGNSLVTGYFSETATFGAGEANETSLTSAGHADIFVAKFGKLFTLTVVKTSGGGTGTVTSDPAGINCGGDCTEDYGQGEVVTLTAYPGVKSYVEWSGDCAGTGSTAQVTMNADKTCIATFGYPVGGIVVPVDRLGLVAPWVGLVGLAGLAALGVVVVRRRKP